MTADERELKRLVSRRLPSHMESVAARDRVLNELRAAPPHLQRARLADPPPAPSERPRVEGLAPSEPEGRVEGWLRPALSLAAAAALIVVVGGVMVWPRGVQAYTAGADGLQVTLADDSRVEMRAHSEMTVARESDGIQIDLKTGDIIVSAAKQRDGHLYVRTKDMTVAVDGTVFLTNAGQQGSRVGVIEGEVRVREEREGSVETRLRPGEQLATSPLLVARPVRDDIIWSRNATGYQAVIDSFLKGVAQSKAPLTPLVRQDVAGAQTTGATAAALEFEEASIRPCDPDNLPPPGGGRSGGGPNSVYMTPGRLYVLCMTPATLIRTAYGYRSVNQEVELGWFITPEAPGRQESIAAGVVFGAPPEDGQRVRGGPDWVRTERYTVEAVAEGLDPKNDTCTRSSIAGGRSGGSPGPGGGPCRTANAAAMQGPMLRALLERRFGLKAHIVTEQVTAYNLVIAPGGLKMKEGTCTPDPSVPRAQGDAARSRQIVDVARKNLDAARRGDATTGLCGTGVADNGPNRVIVGAGSGGRSGAPSEFSSLFRGILGAPVTDRTGIPNEKRFNYALEFLRDERTKNPFYVIVSTGTDMQIAADPSRVQPAPDLFTALEQQLGLRLEIAQVPRDYIVIDAIRRLEPN